jgi:hypothetical protein
MRGQLRTAGRGFTISQFALELHNNGLAKKRGGKKARKKERKERLSLGYSYCGCTREQVDPVE